jgi:class 3 adenylate cyclase
MPEERKLVSILFADVTGSTALGDELDPEDVRALMGRYYEHARQVIPQHGGCPVSSYVSACACPRMGVSSAALSLHLQRYVCYNESPLLPFPIR